MVHVRDDIQKFYAKHGYKPTVLFCDAVFIRLCCTPMLASLLAFLLCCGIRWKRSNP